MSYEVLSQAFYERVSVQIEAVGVDGEVISTMSNNMIVGNSVPVEAKFWFTPPTDGDWTFRLSLLNTEGLEVDQSIGFIPALGNLRPSALGSSSTDNTQPYLQIAFFGSGLDNWGIGLQNETYSNSEAPSGYSWDFGDGSTSSLKNPYHAYSQNGNYTVTLVVIDQGGSSSEFVTWDIFVNDSTDPVPAISRQSVSKNSIFCISWTLE